MDDLQENVLFELSSEIKRAELWGDDYLDCVRVQMLRDVLSLLKAREPIVPKKDKGHRFMFYRCGQCGQAIGTGERPRYCSQCGRAVKWDE